MRYCSTTLNIPIDRAFGPGRSQFLPSVCLGSATLFPVIILPVIMCDWWGLANALSLVIAVLVRYYIVRANRYAIDRSTEKGVHQTNIVVKTFRKLPDGSSVTIYTPRGILAECLLSTPRPAGPKLYVLCRYIAWLAFIVHVFSLGMTAQ